MARRAFRDRFFTPPVASAMTSPLGIVLAGAGAALGLLVGSVPAAIALGAVAWGGRVAAAIPRDPRPDRIDPFTLGDPWKRMVQDAVQAQNRFREAINGTPRGPLRDRMEEIGERVETGVREAWRVGRSGQALAEARRRIDTSGIDHDLAELDARVGDTPGDAHQRTRNALLAQRETATRLERTIADAADQLRLTNALLDEAVASAVELSVSAHDVDDLSGLGSDVETLVTDLEALRLGLEEVDRPATGSS
jgi:hypothetical protein